MKISPNLGKIPPLFLRCKTTNISPFTERGQGTSRMCMDKPSLSWLQPMDDMRPYVKKVHPFCDITFLSMVTYVGFYF